MKRVLIIIGKLYIGGAEKVGRDIGYYADPAKYEIHYIVFGDEVGAYETVLLQRGCRIFHLAAPSEGYGAYYRALTGLIRQYRYDAIHAHTMFSSGWALLAGRRMGVPVRIAHSHSIRGPEHRSWLRELYERGMRRLIVRNATHLVGCGLRAGQWLFGEKAFAQRGMVILNGIDTTRFGFRPALREAVRQELGLADRFVIGHVGHLAPVKNQQFLLELLPKLLAQKPNAALLLLGDGADREALQRKIAELGLTEHVTMTGNVPDVERYLNAMDVFVFPSLYEGMPLSVVEAQVNGLPCVLSDRVPRDVHLTPLVRALSLDEQTKWIQTICSCEREDAQQYEGQLRERGFDTEQMVQRIYDLYGSIE